MSSPRPYGHVEEDDVETLHKQVRELGRIREENSELKATISKPLGSRARVYSRTSSVENVIMGGKNP